MTFVSRDMFEDVMVRIVAAIYHEHETRCTALEAQITGLRTAMAQFKYCGAWSEREYKKGNVVSQGGAIFCADRDTSARPGVGNDWVLMIPKPKDGRDGRNAAEPPGPPEPRTVRTAGRQLQDSITRRR